MVTMPAVSAGDRNKKSKKKIGEGPGKESEAMVYNVRKDGSGWKVPVCLVCLEFLASKIFIREK